MTHINGKYFTASDLSCAYHQVPLSPETQKLTSFVIGGKHYTYQVGFYGLCGLPQWFSRMVAINFEPLIKKKKAIFYIDDSLLQSQTKAEMFTMIDECHQLLRKGDLKATRDKTHFFLRKVKFFGHVIPEEMIQPIAKRVKDLLNPKSPENKRGVMTVLGCLGFYSSYIMNLKVDRQPFYELTKETIPFKWTAQHEELFKEIKTRISDGTTLSVPSTKHPFHIHVDSSDVGTGSILVRQLFEGKRIVSFNSGVFDGRWTEDVETWFVHEIGGRLFICQLIERHVGSIQVDHVSEHVPDHVGMIVFFLVFLHRDLLGSRTFHYAYVASIVPYVYEVSAVYSELD